MEVRETQMWRRDDAETFLAFPSMLYPVLLSRILYFGSVFVFLPDDRSRKL